MTTREIASSQSAAVEGAGRSHLRYGSRSVSDRHDCGGMVAVSIPDDLVGLVAERRVIPFIGAGFSVALNLPDWDHLLALLSEETEGSLPYEELKEHTGSDFLQMAEYLYLKSDERIGPLRHVIEKSMATTADPVTSSAHVELANLGAAQIYTTNYDDLIETTFRSLNIPASVVALPKDVALADSEKTQIVKYHGDLRHENTLVLTESAYYKRLDFESPMDLKFRSDILGRSVLFMGYSFRDINIRIIWFKLMQMMKDIPAADRRESYIIRVEPNPVLEDLYRAVGLKTIVLDPKQSAKSAADRTAMLGEFLYQLGRKASPSSIIPGRSEAMYISSGLIGKAESTLKRQASFQLGFFEEAPPLSESVREALRRRLPDQLEDAFASLLPDMLRLDPESLARYTRRIIELAYLFGPSPELTLFIGLALSREDPRNHILALRNPPWELFWSSKLNAMDAKRVIDRLKNEIRYNHDAHADEDIAYAADVVQRISNGQIVDASERKVRSDAKSAIEDAAKIYPSIADYKPDPKGRPSLDKVLSEVAYRLQELKAQGLLDEQVEQEEDVIDFDPDDPPF